MRPYFIFISVFFLAIGCSQPIEKQNIEPTKNSDTEIPSPPIFECVLRNRTSLGAPMCNRYIMILKVKPSCAFTETQINELKTALKNDGCLVIDYTDETYDGYTNPNHDDWNFNKLKGAFLGIVSADRISPTETEILIRWYRGALCGGGRYFKLLWNGEKWIEDTSLEKFYIS